MNPPPQAYPNLLAATATARCCHRNLKPRPVLHILLLINCLDATTLILEITRSILFGLVVFENWFLFFEGIIPLILLVFNICNSVYICLFTRAKPQSVASSKPKYKISKFSSFRSYARNHFEVCRMLLEILLLLFAIFNNQACSIRGDSNFERTQCFHQ